MLAKQKHSGLGLVSKKGCSIKKRLCISAIHLSYSTFLQGTSGAQGASGRNGDDGDPGPAGDPGPLGPPGKQVRMSERTRSLYKFQY